MNDYIALIRRMPSPSAGAAWVKKLSLAARRYRAPLVFFHGDGLDALSDGDFRTTAEDRAIDWCACQTSLARRPALGSLPPAFRVATLSTLYQAVLSARRIDSLGPGGGFCCVPALADGDAAAPKRTLLEVGFAPADGRQRRETLEMALGAAALELDAVVVFSGQGLGHLTGEDARGWRQIADFELLEMWGENLPPGFVPEVSVRRANSVQAAGLRTGAATILVL